MIFKTSRVEVTVHCGNVKCSEGSPQEGVSAFDTYLRIIKFLRERGWEPVRDGRGEVAWLCPSCYKLSSETDRPLVMDTKS